MLDDASHFFSKSSMPQTVRVRFFHMVSGICAEHSYPSQTNKKKNGHPGHPFRELYDIAEAKDVRELHEVQAELEISEDSAQETTSI